MYVDSFKPSVVLQPKSGAASISQTYLHARTFMNPPPTRPLRVMWEPGYGGYNGVTAFRNDTIWVKAVQDTNTDEWDDDVLLHEFGHYLMKHYAEIPPYVGGPHHWWDSIPDRPNLAYNEAWATLFSSRARVGSSIDSLFIDTGRGIGGGTTRLWVNIENPWIGSFFTPQQFQGGPKCEGSVCGSLLDICDSHSEIPYPSYPWPGFPDTALADTLTMGFDEIWNVFDHYDPPGTPTNCWTIFDFRSGWNYYNYGHQFALNQILLHHRIRDSIPAAPTGLTAQMENRYVRLYWHKNSEPDLKGYRVYRKNGNYQIIFSSISVLK